MCICARQAFAAEVSIFEGFTNIAVDQTLNKTDDWYYDTIFKVSKPGVFIAEGLTFTKTNGLQEDSTYDNISGTEKDFYLKINNGYEEGYKDLTFDHNNNIGAISSEDVVVEYDFKLDIIDPNGTLLANITPIALDDKMGITPYFDNANDFYLGYKGYDGTNKTNTKDTETRYNLRHWYHLKAVFKATTKTVDYYVTDSKTNELLHVQSGIAVYTDNSKVVIACGHWSYNTIIGIDNFSIYKCNSSNIQIAEEEFKAKMPFSFSLNLNSTSETTTLSGQNNFIGGYSQLAATDADLISLKMPSALGDSYDSSDGSANNAYIMINNLNKPQTDKYPYLKFNNNNLIGKPLGKLLLEYDFRINLLDGAYYNELAEKNKTTIDDFDFINGKFSIQANFISNNVYCLNYKGDTSITDSNTKYRTNCWYHCKMLYDPTGTMKYYIYDKSTGKLIASFSTSNSSIATHLNSMFTFEGGFWANGTEVSFDNFKMVTEEFSADQSELTLSENAGTYTASIPVRNMVNHYIDTATTKVDSPTLILALYDSNGSLLGFDSDCVKMDDRTATGDAVSQTLTATITPTPYEGTLFSYAKAYLWSDFTQTLRPLLNAIRYPNE